MNDCKKQIDELKAYIDKMLYKMTDCKKQVDELKAHIGKMLKMITDLKESMISGKCKFVPDILALERIIEAGVEAILLQVE